MSRRKFEHIRLIIIAGKINNPPELPLFQSVYTFLYPVVLKCFSVTVVCSNACHYCNVWLTSLKNKSVFSLYHSLQKQQSAIRTTICIWALFYLFVLKSDSRPAFLFF